MGYSHKMPPSCRNDSERVKIYGEEEKIGIGATVATVSRLLPSL